MRAGARSSGTGPSRPWPAAWTVGSPAAGRCPRCPMTATRVAGGDSVADAVSFPGSLARPPVVAARTQTPSRRSPECPRTPRKPARSRVLGTSSTLTAWCSVACAPRPPACCAASTSRRSPRTSTPATTWSSSTPTRSCSPRARPTTRRCTATAATPVVSRRERYSRPARPQARRGDPPQHPRHAAARARSAASRSRSSRCTPGPEHPHAAQNPAALELPAAKAR